MIAADAAAQARAGALPALPASLTLRNATATAAALRGAAGRDGVVAIDASPLGALDSSALAVLLDLQRDAQARGLGLRIDGAPLPLLRLAQLYGVSALLGLPEPEPDAAARALAQATAKAAAATTLVH